MTELLTIGEVAARSGLATSALRFYEERGLIRSERAPSGHRRYPRDVLRRVSFILAAQRVGLDLETIGAALDRLPAKRTPTRVDWAQLAAEWEPLLDAKIAALTRLRNGLKDCIGCGCLSLDTCSLHNLEDRVAAEGPGPQFLIGAEKRHDRGPSRPRQTSP